jgi:hypothetical protein
LFFLIKVRLKLVTRKAKTNFFICLYAVRPQRLFSHLEIIPASDYVFPVPKVTDKNHVDYGMQIIFFVKKEEGKCACGYCLFLQAFFTLCLHPDQADFQAVTGYTFSNRNNRQHCLPAKPYQFSDRVSGRRLGKSL